MTQPKTYYRDNSSNDVDGIVVVEVHDNGNLFVTENRLRGWVRPFIMPEQEFRTHTHGDSVEEVGVLPDDKFDAVMSKATY